MMSQKKGCQPCIEGRCSFLLRWWRHHNGYHRILHQWLPLCFEAGEDQESKAFLYDPAFKVRARLDESIDNLLMPLKFCIVILQPGTKNEWDFAPKPMTLRICRMFSFILENYNCILDYKHHWSVLLFSFLVQKRHTLPWVDASAPPRKSTELLISGLHNWLISWVHLSCLLPIGCQMWQASDSCQYWLLNKKIRNKPSKKYEWWKEDPALKSTPPLLPATKVLLE